MRSPGGRGRASRRRACRRPSRARPARALSVVGPPPSSSTAAAMIRFPPIREQGGMTPRAVLLAAVIAAALPATAAARSAPPYRVDSPAIEKSRVRAGDRLALGATVRPTGRANQRGVMVAFLVSRDSRWDRGDKVIARRRISKLGERPRRVRARPTLDAPAGGRWHVIVCAGRARPGVGGAGPENPLPPPLARLRRRAAHRQGAARPRPQAAAPPRPAAGGARRPALPRRDRRGHRRLRHRRRHGLLRGRLVA